MNTLMRANALPSLIENFFGRDMNDFFNSNMTAMQNVPAVNVVEHADGFRIEVAAPGLKKEDFKLNLNHNNLTISAYREEKQEQPAAEAAQTGQDGQSGQSSRASNEKYARREFSYTSFQRTFMLPTSVDADQIRANYEDGVLKIEIPKREEAKVKPPRQIEIGS